MGCGWVYLVVMVCHDWIGGYVFDVPELAFRDQARSSSYLLLVPVYGVYCQIDGGDKSCFSKVDKNAFHYADLCKAHVQPRLYRT